jgi:solute carrier family 35 protein E1
MRARSSRRNLGRVAFVALAALDSAASAARVEPLLSTIAPVGFAARRPPLPSAPPSATARAPGADADGAESAPLLGLESLYEQHRPSAAQLAVDSSPRTRALHTLRVALLLAAWYTCNFAYSIANKAALSAWPFPFTFGAIQLAVGVLYCLLLCAPLPAYDRRAGWRAVSLRAPPALSLAQLREMLPVAALLAVGHAAATAAPAYGSVAFTNVVKTTETLFASVCLALVAGEVFPARVYATLVPVVGGVALATVNEIDFSSFTLCACGVSMVSFALYSIWAKRLMARAPYREHGAAALYSALTVVSCALLAPVAACVEGPAIARWWRAAHAAAEARADGAGALSPRLVQLLVLTGLFNYLSNELAFCVLDLCSPLTYAVANTVKRVIVIVGSIVAFQTRVTPVGALGSGTAIAGALMYSLALNSAHTQRLMSRAAAKAKPPKGRGER